MGDVFLRRKPLLTHRAAETILKGRAIVTKEAIKKWFEGLTEYLSTIGATNILDDPDRVFNGDETSFI